MRHFNAKMRTVRRAVLMGGAAVMAQPFVAGGSAMTAGAQEAQQSGQGMQLEEIVITARRTAERITDAPQGVNVMTGEYISKQRIQTADDVIQFTPGATFIAFNKTQPEYSIRGISQRAEGSSLESAVVTVVDEVPISKDILKNPAMFDMERVEVLRGPQGTAFGRNASAGLVHLVTRRPSFDFEAEVTAGAGSHELAETNGFVNVPLSDTLATRIAYNFDKYDGYTESVSTGKGLNGQRNLSVRGSLLYEPTPNFTAYFKAEYNDDDDETPVRRSRNSTVPQLIAATDADLRAQFAGPGHPPWPNTFFDPADEFKTEISDGDFFLKREMLNLTGELTWEFGDGYTLTSVTGYIDGDTNRLQEAHGTPQNVLWQRGVQDAEILTQEIRINNHGTGSALRWLGGFMYLHDEHDWFNENQFFQDGAAGRPDTRATRIQFNETDSFAFFGEISYDITDRLTATGGGRWTRDEKDARIAHTGFGFGGPISFFDDCTFFPPGGQFICGNADNPVGFADPVPVSDNWTDFMGKFSLDYRVNAEHMVYFLFSQGFKSGGFQVEPPNPEAARISFDEELSNNFEVGWKGEFGGRARVSVTAFWLDYDDLQLLQFEETQAGFFQIIRNAGSARSIGLEVEGTVVVASNFRIDVTGALQDPELTADVDITGDGVPDPTDGFRLDNAPTWTATVAAEYDFSLDDGSILTLRGDYRGRSDVWDDIINRDLTQPGPSEKPMRLRPNANIFGLRLTWTSESGAYGASLWGQNITGEEEVLNIGPPQPNTIDRPTQFGAPTTYGGSFTISF